MGKIMYMPQARELLGAAEDVRVICATHRKNMDFPMVDVRYAGDSIGYLGRDFMDEKPHREWNDRPGRDVSPDVPYQDTKMWMRPSWRTQMSSIERRLPSRVRACLRKKALKMGFKWWAN